MQSYFLRPRGCAQTSLLQIPKQLVNGITQDLLNECFILHASLNNCYHFLWAHGLQNIFNYLTIRLRDFFHLIPPSLIAPQNSACPHHQCMTVLFIAHFSHPALKAAFHKDLTDSHGASGEMNYQWRWLCIESQDTLSKHSKLPTKSGWRV